MRPAHCARTTGVLMTLAALTLTGCVAATPPDGPASAPSSATPPAAATPAPAPGSATPTATPGSAPPSSDPAPAGLATFTFPEERLSFEYPADWRVELFTAAESPFTGTATVFDIDGAKQATIYTGRIADGVTSPVTRTVFESAPVPGMQGQPAPTAHYSFYVDRVNEIATYRMHLTAGAPIAGAEMVLDGIIRTADGVIVADVHFIDSPFADDGQAQAWLAGTEGQALKTLLLSLSYR